eukprot:539502_1
MKLENKMSVAMDDNMAMQMIKKDSSKATKDALPPSPTKLKHAATVGDMNTAHVTHAHATKYCSRDIECRSGCFIECAFLGLLMFVFLLLGAKKVDGFFLLCDCSYIHCILPLNFVYKLSLFKC